MLPWSVNGTHPWSVNGTVEFKYDLWDMFPILLTENFVQRRPFVSMKLFTEEALSEGDLSYEGLF